MELNALKAILADWKANFSDITLGRARQLQRDGRVLKCKATGTGLIASVQGSRSDPYKVEIFWDKDDGELSFSEGSCSCPMEFNCKHVAAAILEALKSSPASHFSKTPGPLAIPSKPSLPAPLENWLAQLHQAAAPPAPVPEASPLGEAERLVYVLNVETIASGAVASERLVSVGLEIVRRLANGNYGGGRPYTLEFLSNNVQREPCVRPVDISLVRRILVNQPSGFFYGHNILAGPEGVALLEEILRTGRCHWRGTGKKHPILSLGKPRLAKLEWHADSSGMQSPGFNITPHATSVLPLAPPWYLDESSATSGPLDTGLPPAVAHAWFNAPTLKPDEAEVVGEELARRYPELHVPAPRRIEVETVTNLKPTPCLRLYSQPVVQNRYGYGWGGTREPDTLDVNLARLEFDYEGQRVIFGSPVMLVEQLTDGKLRRIQRQPKMETLCAVQLRKLGFSEASSHFPNYRLGKHSESLTLPDSNSWFEFCQSQLPKLRAEGWQVDLEQNFRFRIAEPENWYADADGGSGIDWFGVEMGVQLDGQKVNLLPILLEQIQRNPRLLSGEELATQKENAVIPIRLADGRLLPFPIHRLKEMLGVLLELFDTKSLDRSGRLQLSKLRAAELSAITANSAGWRWLGSNELRELSTRLRDFSGIKHVAPSPHLRAVLRPYQQDGLNWLQFLREYGLAGILADDMGLGKTVQAIAHLLHEREQGHVHHPSLVVAPTSLMTNWRQEVERFAPTLKLLILHGADRKQHFENLPAYDLIVTSYPLLPRDQAVLLDQPFHYVILDEAQFIKNPRTQFAQIVCQLQAAHRVCLTGTPMENHLGELWSLFHFLLPGFLGDEARFRKIFRNPIEKGGSAERRQLLARRVAPFILRRRKDDVVKELPPKTEIVQNVELAGAQRDLYETIRLAMHSRVREEVSNKGLSRAHIVILDALLKLRQVCCDPRLLKMDAAQKITESAKLQLLMDLLPEMISEGRRVLLFSQFTSMLALIETEITKANIPYVLLTGQTTDRATPIAKFQNGEVPVFLISLKAGGTGLNLTAADTVIHYDPWWNPAVENQATDRAHRIGQDKKVFVYKLMTVGTVEEKILQLQARKRELVEGLLDEQARESVKLSPADLDLLFAPLT
jgi:SNF2 family DNA or RNA helicase